MRRDPWLLAPPSGGAPQAEWRAFYLQHSAYELLNVGTAFLTADELEDHHIRLADSLRMLRDWCSSPILGAVAESDMALRVTSWMRGLRHITFSRASDAADNDFGSDQIRSQASDFERRSLVQLAQDQPIKGRNLGRCGIELMEWAARTSAVTPDVISPSNVATLATIDVACTDNANKGTLRSLALHAHTFATQFQPTLLASLFTSPRVSNLEVLDISNAVLCEHSIAALADGVARLDALHTLVLSGCHLGADVRRLAEALVGHRGLRRLDLAQNNLGSSAANMLSMVLLQPWSNDNARAGGRDWQLGVGEPMQIDDDGAPPPAKRARGDGTLLEYLELSHNPLGEEGVKAIALGAKRCGTLTRLGVNYVDRARGGDSRLEPVPLAPLLEVPSLRELHSSYNYIGTSPTVSGATPDDLKEALATNTSITALDLRRCCIGGWRRARAIARGVARNTALTDLDLGYNGLGAATPLDQNPHPSGTVKLSLAINAVCEALRENTTLTRLSLAHNVLGDYGALAVLQSAFQSRSLRSLDLRANRVTLRGIRALICLLQERRIRWLPAAPHSVAAADTAASGTGAVVAAGPALADVVCSYDVIDGALPHLALVDLRANANDEMLASVAGGDDDDGLAPALNDEAAMALYARMAEIVAPPPPTKAPSGEKPGTNGGADGGGVDGGGGESQRGDGLSRKWRLARDVCPFYMTRQDEVNPSMRMILINWLVELYDELELHIESLLHAVHEVDRFLSANTVAKETLQLVGATALMLASNHFTKLFHQDGESPAVEHALNHAEDIVYWTDGTYTIEEVYEMEVRMLYGFDIGRYETPWQHLSLIVAGSGLSDAQVSLASELIIESVRIYALLRLHPRLIAACTLFIAIYALAASGAAPLRPARAWSRGLALRCGYPTEAILDAVDAHFGFLDGTTVNYPSVASGCRARSESVQVWTKSVL